MSAQFEAIAQAVIHDWPDYGWSGLIEAAIKQLYLSELTYPATWSSDRCAEFAESHAGDDALLLTSSLDDLIDTVTDCYVRDHGVLPIVTIQLYYLQRRVGTCSTSWSSGSRLTYLPRSPR